MSWRLFGNFISPKTEPKIEVSTPRKFNYYSQSKYYSITRVANRECDVEGHGIDSDPVRSQLKSFMEALERFSLRLYEGPLWASACHWNPFAARQAAVQEAIERDALFGWSLGHYGHRRIYEENGLCFLKLESPYKRSIVALCASLNSACVPFGTGAGTSWKSASEKAFNELVMSLIRHDMGSCAGSRAYDLLHANTFKNEFRDKLSAENSPLKAPAPKTPNLKIKKLSGIHRWPLNVYGVTSADLSLWDTQKIAVSDIRENIFAG